MKRKILSLLLCFAFIFVCFSSVVSATDGVYYIPGEIIVIVAEALSVPDTTENFELYGVVVGSVYVYDISETESAFLMILPEGANSQEETEAAIEILKANPVVIAADQNFEWDAIEEPIPVYKLGDVNGDGVHDTKDYTLIKRAMAGTYTFNDKASAVADINGNGEVDTHDYILAKRSTMDTYNIQLPMTALTEAQISDMIEDYLTYISRIHTEETFTKDDVFIDEAKTYGPYGYSGVYVVQILNLQLGYPEGETHLEIGGRTLGFFDGNLPLVWTGHSFFDLEDGYNYGFLSDVDLEDLETRYNIED